MDPVIPGGVTDQLPQNAEAEASLLGALLIDSDAVVKIADSLNARDFYDLRNQRIYEAITQLYERHEAIDVLTLSDRLKNNGYLESIGGSAYLTELTNFVPTAAHAEQYADIVAQKAMRRRLIAASKLIGGLGYDESKQMRELVEEAETKLFEISQQHIKQSIVPLEAILAESFDRLDDLHKDKQKIRGIPTGYKDLDNMLAGFQRSDLVVLAARPSMGKTSLALNFAHNISIQSNEPVLIFSLEMSKEQLVDRLLSMESGVDAWALRTGNLTDSDFEKIGHAMGTLSEAQIFIDDTPGLTMSDLRTKARREAHKHPLGLIIVDYLQLMSGGSRFGGDFNRVQEISEISRGLKGVARELNVPVLALSQLSRSVESRNPQIPQLADLRESGCLTGDTLVYSPNQAKYIPIRDLVGHSNQDVCALDISSYKLQVSPATKAFSTGRKPVFRLTTSTGRTIRATANHKFLAIDGWKRLDELGSGSHIAIPRVLPSPQKDASQMTNSEAALLGHLLGDGCIITHNSIQYITKDFDLAQKVSELAKVCFGELLSLHTKRVGQCYRVCLSSTHGLTHAINNPLTVWLNEINASDLRTNEKRLPAILYKQSNEVIATFLRHLWAANGCVKTLKKDKRPEIYYDFRSEALTRDLQSLLLRLAINGRLSRYEQKGKSRHQFYVKISGIEDMSKFMALIGAVGHTRTSQLALISKHISASIRNPNKDIIPSVVCRAHAVSALEIANLSARQIHPQLDTSNHGSTLNKAGLLRQPTAQVADKDKSSQHLMLASSEIYWDRIVSVEPEGVEEVFDLTVSELHNFIANDIIVHNSIEQDADLVAFIYREDYYNPDTDRKKIADIFIKKHRNGPTGGVELYFDNERQRFRSVESRRQDPFNS